MLSKLFALLDQGLIRPPHLCLYLRLIHEDISGPFDCTPLLAAKLHLHPRTFAQYCKDLDRVYLLEHSKEGFSLPRTYTSQNSLEAYGEEFMGV